MSTEKQIQQDAKRGADQPGKIDVNNTECNKTDPNYIDAIIRRGRECVYGQIQKNICYDALLDHMPESLLNGIVDVIVSTVCSQNPIVRVAGKVFSREEARRRLWELGKMDIQYVSSALYRENNEIRSLPGYILKKLFEAKTLSEAYYDRWVDLDMRKHEYK